MSLVFDSALIFFLFALFGYSHSLLASRKFKENLANNIGDKIAFYRLFYNLISIISFVAIIGLSPKPDVVLYDLPNPYDLVFFALQVVGFTGLLWAVKVIDVMEFLGINQIKRYFNGSYNQAELDEHSKFLIEGPFKFCRHPIYFFSIIMLMFSPSMNLWYLITLINIVIYFYVGSIYEERKLEKLFGVQYSNYKNDVPRIIPYKIFKRK